MFPPEVPTEEELTTNTEKLILNLENPDNEIRVWNDLCEFFIKIDSLMERSLI